MKCFYHEDREAVAQCKSCGKGLCKECAAARRAPYICDECAEILRKDQELQVRNAEAAKKQKYLDALIDTRDEFVRACAGGAVCGIAFAVVVVYGGANFADALLAFFLGFFIPFGWKLITYKQASMTIFIGDGAWIAMLAWYGVKITLSLIIGIFAFIYQAYRTFSAQKKIDQVDVREENKTER